MGHSTGGPIRSAFTQGSVAGPDQGRRDDVERKGLGKNRRNRAPFPGAGAGRGGGTFDQRRRRGSSERGARNRCRGLILDWRRGTTATATSTARRPWSPRAVRP